VVGSTVDTHSGKLTYGGERRAAWWRRTSFVKVQPSEQAQTCESMNGNIVLIPAESARLVGNLDPAFEHAMGDTDYALRANKLGVGVWVAPGVHGTCGHNAFTNTFLDSNLPLSKRWQQMLGRKGLPWRSWWVLTRRHAGLFWPLFFAWPYARVVFWGWKRRI
jgi:GT2 family glycosyltransferase